MTSQLNLDIDSQYFAEDREQIPNDKPKVVYQPLQTVESVNPQQIIEKLNVDALSTMTKDSFDRYVNGVSKETVKYFSRDVIEALLTREDTKEQTLIRNAQFIFQSHFNNLEYKERIRELEEKNIALGGRVQVLEAELDKTNSALGQTALILESVFKDLQTKTSELEQARKDLDQEQAAHDVTKSELKQKQSELDSEQSTHRDTRQLLAAEQMHHQNTKGELSTTQSKLSAEQMDHQQTQRDLGTERASRQQTQSDLGTERVNHQQTQSDLRTERMSHQSTRDQLNRVQQDANTKQAAIDSMKKTLNALGENQEKLLKPLLKIFGLSIDMFANGLTIEQALQKEVNSLKHNRDTYLPRLVGSWMPSRDWSSLDGKVQLVLEYMNRLKK